MTIRKVNSDTINMYLHVAICIEKTVIMNFEDFRINGGGMDPLVSPKRKKTFFFFFFLKISVSKYM